MLQATVALGLLRDLELCKFSGESWSLNAPVFFPEDGLDSEGLKGTWRLSLCLLIIMPEQSLVLRMYLPNISILSKANRDSWLLL